MKTKRLSDALLLAIAVVFAFIGVMPLRAHIPADPDERRQQARKALDQHDYDALRRILQTIDSERSGEHPSWFYTYRGELLLASFQPRKALEAFKRGPDNGPNMAGTAAALVRLGRDSDARGLLKTLIEEYPEAEKRARRLLDVLNPPEGLARPSRERLRYGGGFGAGYNDNVTARPESSDIRFGDITNESDHYQQARFHVSRPYGDNQRLKLYARGFTRLYRDLARYDRLRATAGARYRPEQDNLSLGAEYSRGFIDDSPSFSALSAYGSLLMRPDEQYGPVRLSLRAQTYHDRQGTIAESDGSGPRLAGRLTYYPDRSGTYKNWTISATPFVGAGVHHADGGSARNDYAQIGTAVRARRDRSTVRLHYSLTERSYDQPGVRTATSVPRRDRTQQLQLQYRYDLSERWTAVGQYNHTNTNSNVPALFSYEQDDLTFSASYRY